MAKTSKARNVFLFSWALRHLYSRGITMDPLWRLSTAMVATSRPSSLYTLWLGF
jgi:hypothetical protein